MCFTVYFFKVGAVMDELRKASVSDETCSKRSYVFARIST